MNLARLQVNLCFKPILCSGRLALRARLESVAEERVLFVGEIIKGNLVTLDFIQLQIASELVFSPQDDVQCDSGSDSDTIAVLVSVKCRSDEGMKRRESPSLTKLSSPSIALGNVEFYFHF